MSFPLTPPFILLIVFDDTFLDLLWSLRPFLYYPLMIIFNIPVILCMRDLMTLFLSLHKLKYMNKRLDELGTVFVRTFFL